MFCSWFESRRGSVKRKSSWSSKSTATLIIMKGSLERFKRAARTDQEKLKTEETLREINKILSSRGA
jgi:hypothetical protein